MSEERWYEAVERFKSILDRTPDPHNLLAAVAACFDGMDNYLTAAEYYEKALVSCPDALRSDLLYQLGVSRACAERIDKAADAFQECLALQDNPAARDHVVRLLDRIKEVKDGRCSPTVFLVQVQLQRAFSEMDAEKFESAAARLEHLIPMDSENPAIFYNLGVVYMFLKREGEALAYFRKSVELNPDYVQAWYNMGQIALLSRKDFSQALHCFGQAASIRPDYIGAHHQRGVAYELLGDKERAVECWERTLELDPENVQARENLERVRKALADQPSPKTS